MNKRPLTIALVGWLFIATGIVSLAFHLTEIKPQQLFQVEYIWIFPINLLAIVGGVFLLRGSNWARWLVLAWIAFHVGLSFFHSLQEVLVHGLLFLLIAYALFRSDARAYFPNRATTGE